MDELEYPRMVYRSGGECALESGNYSIKIVADADDLEASQADGWHLDQYAAKDAAEALTAKGDDDTTPPTRAELEAKATELGVRFDGRISDKTLAARIADALKA